MQLVTMSTPSSPPAAVLPRTGSGGGLLNERDVVRRAGKEAIAAFLESHTCFSVLRASGKVVVFDTRIPIQLAFYALVEHGTWTSYRTLYSLSMCVANSHAGPVILDMQCAPLWDAASCQFVGILTVTDFIDVLRYYRFTRTDVTTLATRTIADIFSDGAMMNSVLLRYHPRRGRIPIDTSNVAPSSTANPHTSFLSADTNTTLQQACRILHSHSLDFLSVLYPEDMRVLAAITYTTILEHLVTHFREQRRLFDDTVYDLGIGTYHEHVITISLHQTLEDALHLMQLHGLSAIPVVDPITLKIKGVYARSDITFLASASDAEDALSNLEMTLEALLGQQRTDVITPDALHTCSTQHTLQSIFEYFAQWKFNRLIVLDEEERVQGVVSARDLVAYFLGE
jgi:5'-AMP-activated protein kinase regulatory gamma subunit